MYSIFVNYRRGEHSVAVAALVEMLAHHFGRDEVFLDVGIPSGERYPQEIEERLHGCDVLVSVIHNGWAATFGQPRRKDWVRYEIRTALRKNTTVIPVVLEDAAIPAWEQLPEDIADILLLQSATLRSAEFRGDVDNLIRRIEHHVDLDGAAARKAPVRAKPKRTWLRIAALAVALYLVTLVMFFDSVEDEALWRRFAEPAFASTALLVLASSLTMIATWPLKRLSYRWERNAGTRTYREALSRNWIVPALLFVATAFGVSRAMTEDGGWQEWEVWYVGVVVLFGLFYLHRQWRISTVEDHAWPPPVTTDHWLFRRAALRLHEKLTTDKEWRTPRSRTLQRQAVSVYLDLAQARLDLIAKSRLSLGRWILGGHSGETTVYVAWYTSILVLDVSAVAALVFGEHVPGNPLLVIAITVVAATAFTAAMVTTHLLLDRYRVRKRIEELTEWQGKLGPLIFCVDEPS
ncbi:TIR domain-containing protein [Actinophytocola sp.]|uniref:TIR domain-containing protein n=1 Tax=Actinophytocola sp. TaxID=1872138 RepID=UPI002ED39B3E